MSAIIFHGQHFAAGREAALRAQVTALPHQPKIVSLYFQEDHAGSLYTGLKQQAAARVGIPYEPLQFSMTTPVAAVLEQLRRSGADPSVTGVMVQKPSRPTWQRALGKTTDDPIGFQTWWQSLVEAIPLAKDVDSLHPETQRAIDDGTWQERGMVLPATAQAVLLILEVTHASPPASVIIIGKSDLLGRPLAAVLRQRGWTVQLWGRKELAAWQAQAPAAQELPAAVIVSATGQANLITSALVPSGAVVIDVGEPKGDVDPSVRDKAAFLTPVPGGVGPVTVISLLENAARLAQLARE